MHDPKTEAAAAIAQAQASLAAAVAELDKLPAVDARSIALGAHALSNFLTVSTAVVDLLIPILRSHPEPEVRRWLDGLAHANNLMAHTVSQLMTSSVGTEPALQLEDVALPRLVERACAYYRIGAQSKGIELIFGAAADVSPVRTDRVLVAAILDNFLSNAVKYSPPARRIWVDVDAEGAGVVCRVRDEGPGLSRDDQGRLFLPGVRLGPVPSGGEPSNGYGLAIAKRFAERLRGEVRCTSAPREGSTFSLWLPRRLSSSDR